VISKWQQLLKAWLLGVFLVTLVAVGSALAQTPVNQCGQVLSEPGKYVVTTNICKFTGIAPAIPLTITASNVKLNTAGFTIGSLSAALEIVDGVSGVTINGGGTFFDGVRIGAVKNITLDHLTLTASASFTTAPVVQLKGTNKLSITNSTISQEGCTGAAGVVGMVDKGLFAKDIFETGTCGPTGTIMLTGTKNTIRGNTITLQNGFANVSYAISVDSDSVIDGNTISLENGGLPLPQMNEIGINLMGDSNQVKNNTIQGSVPNQNYGIFVAHSATGNSITKNTVSGNQFDLFDSNGPPCVNTWKRNSFQTSGGAVACIN
jgi:hypothetical protein